MNDLASFKQKPLQGVRVLEFGGSISAPVCAQLLGGLGAEVIKIEPIDGDRARFNTPYLGSGGVDFNSDAGDNMSISHLNRNRNKKSITLNLKSTEGKEIALKLAANADILIENNKPGAMDKMGIGYKDLEKINPQLIYASISGFGQEGRRRGMRAYDAVVQALSGIMDATGSPEGAPTRIGVPMADYVAALTSTIAILGALAYRDRTGVGQWVDVPMLDGMMTFVAGEAFDVYARYNKQYRTANYHHRNPLFCTAQTLDGYVSIAAQTDADAFMVFRTINREDMISNERYNNPGQRGIHAKEVFEIVENWSKNKTSAEAVEALTAQGVLCCKVSTVGEILSDLDLIERKAIVPLVNPLMEKEGELVMGAGLPFNFSKTPVEYDSPAPSLGQHNEEIICEKLGYSRNELDKLKERGVI